ncbi:MAG: M23 family metallopeptidase [Hyphomicrobiaceae bacterium]|nr:M23 family metallopeptidase [Hyphomicrobiaceae bacterium]
MVDRRRYPAGTFKRAQPRAERPRGLPQISRGRARDGLRNMFDSDRTDTRKGERFRWLVSTCLAGAVGAVAIFAVIAGSTDTEEEGEGLMPAIRRLQDGALAPPILPQMRRSDGLNWSVPKTDKLALSTGAVSTRFVIHDSLRQRRNGRVYIYAKPYLRVVARLAPVPDSYADVIPPFNPFKLYADTVPIAQGEQSTSGLQQRNDVQVKVVELLGGILPGEDEQELDNREVAEIIERARIDAEKPAAEEQGSSFGTLGEAGSDGVDPAQPAPNTTVLAKTVIEGQDANPGLENARRIVVTPSGRESLAAVIVRNGAETWLAEAMVEAARALMPNPTVTETDEVHITVVPSLTQPDRMEPIAVSVYGEGHDHKVTVSRSDTGEFVASTTPLKGGLSLETGSDGGKALQMSLYASVYYAALLQNIAPETIMQILKVHAYDLDFGRRIRAGDMIEFFFDFNDENVNDGPPGELLYTQITSGGETSRFYRFRGGDRELDFFDDSGNNSKRFLMRKPVRGSDVRLVSGYGLRFHPLLNRRRMHTGVDWAAPPGTPILAAGRGVIETAGRKGQYGNYIRIRHANGYNTAYAHLSNFARGVKEGVKVRQGQVIGYVGSTGLSSGPHLHFEILVNTRFVDPMSIQVPKERQLNGRELNDFQREKARLDELMRRAPVMQKNK